MDTFPVNVSPKQSNTAAYPWGGARGRVCVRVCVCVCLSDCKCTGEAALVAFTIEADVLGVVLACAHQHALTPAARIVAKGSACASDAEATVTQA